MKISILKNSKIIIVGIPLLLTLSLIILSKSTVFYQNQSELSIAITLDLLLTIPLIYFLLIRKKEISKISILFVVTIGVFIAGYVIPKSHQQLLEQIKLMVLPILELVLIFFIFNKVKKSRHRYKLHVKYLDVYQTIQQVCLDVFPKKIAVIVASEIGMLYYIFWGWKGKEIQKNEFTYHKKGVSVSFLIGFMMMILFETIGVHFLIRKSSNFWAWIVSVLSIYTILQLVALIRSFSKRLTIIDKNKHQLVLRYGYFSETIISFENIKSIEFYQQDLPEDKSVACLSFFGKISDYNMRIQLHNSSIIYSVYGLKKSYTSLVFFVDEKQQFKGILSKEINQN